jgi:4-hydroxybenzoyl-CoA thioesterase
MASSVYTVKVEWGDCDPARIVYYPNFFSWFDAATRHLFESNGLLWDAMTREHGSRGFPLVDARASFRRPARFGDVLEIETRLKRWSTRSFELEHVIRIGGQVAVEGSETRIWGVNDPARPEGLKAGQIPASVKARIPAESA